MLRPRIQAPRFSKPRAAKSSSTPPRPASSPNSGPAPSTCHLLERPRAEDPLVQRHPPDAHRIGQILVGTGAVTIDRDPKSVHPKLRHEHSSFRFRTGTEPLRGIVTTVFQSDDERARPKSTPICGRSAASEQQFFRELRAGETSHEGQPLHRGLPLDGRDHADPAQGMGEPGRIPTSATASAGTFISRASRSCDGWPPATGRTSPPLPPARAVPPDARNHPGPSPATNVPA